MLTDLSIKVFFLNWSFYATSFSTTCSKLTIALIIQGNQNRDQMVHFGSDVGNFDQFYEIMESTLENIIHN